MILDIIRRNLHFFHIFTHLNVGIPKFKSET